MSKISELVAVEVMGYKHEPVRVVGSTETVMVYRDAPQWPKDGYHNATELVSRWSMPPAFDEDITDAWRVVEKMREKGWKFAMEDTHYEGVFVRFRKGNESYTSSTFDGDRFAICLAALRACGVSEDRIEQARENA